MSVNDDGTVDVEGPFRVVSTARPLTMGTRDVLEEYGIVGEITAGEVDDDTRPLGVGDQTVVGLILEERPPRRVRLDREVSLLEEPIEVWTDGNQEVEIFPDYVRGTSDGIMNIDPDEAAEYVREEDDRFRAIEVPEDSPFGPVEESELTFDQIQGIARSFGRENAQIGRWGAVPPNEMSDEPVFLVDAEPILQYRSPPQEGGRIYAGINARETEDDDGNTEIDLEARAAATGDINFSSSNIGFRLEGIDDALEELETWLETHPATTEYPTFRMRINNAILNPMLDVHRRINGGLTLLQADDDGIEIRGPGMNTVRLEIPAESAEEYTLTAAGTAMINVSDAFDGIADINYEDGSRNRIDVTLEADGGERTLISGQKSTSMKHRASETNSIKELSPGAAQVIMDGTRFRDVVQSAGFIDPEGTAAVGIRDGQAFLSVSAKTGDEFQGDFRGRSAIGEGLSAASVETLREIQQAMARPARTDVTLNVVDQGDVGLFYNQNGSSVEIILPPNGLSDLDGIETRPPSEVPFPPPGVGDVGEENGDDGGLPPNVESGRWDAVLVARPDGDFRERFEARVLPDEHRASPDLELPDESLEQLEEDGNRNLEAWMYEDGDVVSAASYGEEVRREPRIRAQTYEPGVDLLTDRTTDDDGNLTVTSDDGWVGVPPRALREADEGDLQTGWNTSPLFDPDKENIGFGALVGWDDPGVQKYAYNELTSLPYFVYRWNEDTETMEGMGSDNSPARRYYTGLYRAPPDDEIIGLVDQSDAGPTPADPVFRSEYEDEYDLFPFFRSADAVEEMIGETVLARTSGGFIKEVEIVQAATDGAGVLAADEQIPDGQYYIPASSGHDDSTFNIIGKPKDDTDEADEPVDEPDEAGDEPDAADAIMRRVDVTRDVAEAVERSMGQTLPSTVDGAINALTNRIERGDNLAVPSLGMMEADELRDGIQRTQLRDDEPDDDPDGRGGDDTEREVEVKVRRRGSGFDTGLASRARLSLSPPISDNDPRDIAREIRNAVTDAFGTGFARFLEYSEPIAIATVRGGTLEEGQYGIEQIDSPAELIDVEFQVAVNEGPDATINDVRDAFPAFSSPQAADVVEFIGPVEDVLQFTPAALTEIKGIADRTVANIIGAGYMNTRTLGDQGAEIEGVEEAEDSGEVGPFSAGVGGSIQVGRRTVDVPNPTDGWDELRFYWRNEEPDGVEGDGVVAAYISDDRATTMTIEGTMVSNKWGMRVYAHRDPIGGSPSLQEVKSGLGPVDQTSLTSGNTADSAATTIIENEWVSPEEAREAVREQGGGEFSWQREFEDRIEEFPVSINIFGQLTTERAASNRALPSSVREEAFQQVEDEIGDPEQYVSGDVNDRDEIPLGTISVNTAGYGQGREPEVVGVEVSAPEDVDEQPSEEDIRATIESINAALSETEDVLDDARDAGAMGRGRIGRVQQSVIALERLLTEVEDDPTLSDVEEAQEATGELLERLDAARDVIEEVREETDDEPETGDGGELSRGEIETVVENATAGVDVTAVIIEGSLQRIRMEPDGSIPFDPPGNITTPSRDTRHESIRAAIGRWEEFADLSTVNVDRVNTRREALTDQFGVELPVLEVTAGEEPEPDDGPEEEPPEEPPESGDDVVTRLEEEFARELGGMGLPSRPRPPATFEVDEEMETIIARPNVPPEWEGVLGERPPLIRGPLDDPEGFLGDYIEALFQAIDYSQVDAAAINQRRQRLNERYGLTLPLLGDDGRPIGGGDGTESGQEGDEPEGVREVPLRVRNDEYVVSGSLPAGVLGEVRQQAESALGPADQFESETRVGEALISDDEVAVRVPEGEQILDARRQEEDIEERAPTFDMDAPLTPEVVQRAFPRLLPGVGQMFSDEFSTLREMVDSPLGDIEAIYGVGDGILRSITDRRPMDMEASLRENRDRPLGIDEDVPTDSPMPEVLPDDEQEETEDVPEGITGGLPGRDVSIPPSAPRGEKWLAEQIERQNRLQPNDYSDTPIVEIVFPERISERVRNVVSQNDISRGGTGGVMVQNPSFRDELPREAAALKSIQFLLSVPTDLRSSGFDIQQIVSTLSDRLLIVTRSPVVRAPILFE